MTFPSGHELGNEEIGVGGKKEEMYCKYIHVTNGVLGNCQSGRTVRSE